MSDLIHASDRLIQQADRIWPIGQTTVKFRRNISTSELIFRPESAFLFLFLFYIDGAMSVSLPSSIPLYSTSFLQHSFLSSLLLYHLEASMANQVSLLYSILLLSLLLSYILVFCRLVRYHFSHPLISLVLNHFPWEVSCLLYFVNNFICRQLIKPSYESVRQAASVSSRPAGRQLVNY